MTPTPAAAAILPSRNEPETIGNVISAVDTALNDPRAVIIHADSSDTRATALAATRTPTRAKLVQLADLPRGKGAQILAAAR
ncbi:hypothetical protein [Streptomyces sp. SM12]|uniref:hypothetical protein n=1 Tax=Streptomyces sp. SM12 TaxID=1071602 RepID=UPI0021561D1A|nr:hypothetical protein [Streptomyces sp. SM12]